APKPLLPWMTTSSFRQSVSRLPYFGSHPSCWSARTRNPCSSLHLLSTTLLPFPQRGGSGFQRGALLQCNCLASNKPTARGLTRLVHFACIGQHLLNVRKRGFRI